jgi:outer membrane protein insertion porin family
MLGNQPMLDNASPILADPGPQFYETPERYIPLDAYASETQTGRFMFGVGVNSDAGLVGSIVLDEQNFDWRRVPTSWEDFRNGTAFRGAGQRFRLEAAPGTEVQRYLFNFQEPYFLDTPVSLGLSGFFYDRRFRDWDEQRLGGRVSWGYMFSPDLSGTVALRAEQIEITNPRTPSPQDLIDVLGTTNFFSVKGTMVHDTRDSTFLPTQGHYIELGFEQAFGDFVFPRMNLDMRQHFVLHERPDTSGRHVLSLIGRLGVSGEDTPLYERFFAGGFSTLRGFAFRGASPVDLPTGVVVGGEFQALGTVEYLFPITADDMLRGVTFVDFGTVERTASIDGDNFRVAPGVGLRVSVPALGPAPIALDFAFPVLDAEGDREQMFSFFVGFGR